MEIRRRWDAAMILYTTIPHELIFQSKEEDFNKQKVVQVNGVSMLVMEHEPMRYQIVRILSSNPKHFLIDSLMPGQIIEHFEQESSFM